MGHEPEDMRKRTGLGPHDIRSQLSQENLGRIRELGKVRQWRNGFLYVQVFAAILMAMYLESAMLHPLATVVAIIFIAGRQHSLYILNHDASHYSLFHSRRVDKFVGTVFSNLVMFHHPEAWSFVQWRRIHMFHHQYLFTEGDPNYVGRQMRGDTQRNYTPLQLLRHCIKTGLSSFTQLFLARQDYVLPKGKEAIKGKYNHLWTLFMPFHNDPEMETERWIKLVFFAISLAIIAYFDLWRQFLLLWIVPMYTVYPMILTFMDLTEHRWTEGESNLNLNTRSVKPGLLGKLLISSLPRGLHREHHVYPNIVAADLPKLSEYLRETKLAPPLRGVSALFKELAQQGRFSRELLQHK